MTNHLVYGLLTSDLQQSLSSGMVNPLPLNIPGKILCLKTTSGLWQISTLLPEARSNYSDENLLWIAYLSKGKFIYLTALLATK
jgi:hypothetical protein